MPGRAGEEAGWHRHAGRGHTHLPPRGASLSWRGLFALGLAGGMVPSVSALILLLGSISLGRPAYGIALTVAFGVGMAVVLVGVGLLLVYARGLLERFPAGGRGRRLGRLLPTATAVVVLLAGLLITTQALMTLR
jgi:nickel/cobalt exporter